MSRVVVVGGAGQGRQVIDVLTEAGEHLVVGVLDPGLVAGSVVAGLPVLDPGDLVAGADGFVVAIGDNTVRAAAIGRIRAEHPHLELVRAVHPAAVVARDAVVGAGALLMAGVVVSNGCTLGEGVLMGTRSSVDHDCTVGDHAGLAPGATTGGDVWIGERSAVLLGADVIHGVSVGADTVVGAGAVVIADLPDRVVALGVPARVVRPREPGSPYLDR